MPEEQNTQPEQDVTEPEAAEASEVEAPSVETPEQTEEPAEEKLECSMNVEDSGPWKKKISKSPTQRK